MLFFKRILKEPESATTAAPAVERRSEQRFRVSPDFPLKAVLSFIGRDESGAPMSMVRVVHGDTAVVPRGNGTGGSRSLQTGGSATVLAVRTLVEQARTRAAELLEAHPDDIVLDRARGVFHVAGAPAVACTWAAVAVHAGGVLRAEHDFGPTTPTFPFGCHVAVVEVNPVRAGRQHTVGSADDGRGPAA